MSNFKTNQSSGCFITTITCQILGKNDDDLILNDLRAFRDNILQQNTQYFDILKEYDSIGPVIANYLFNDPDKIQLATCLYQNIIIPINELIQKKEYQKAVEAYYQMTLLLINYYGLKHHYNTLKENDYDYPNFNPRLAGHGRKRIKTPSPKLG